MEKKPSVLEQNCRDLSLIVLEWYEQKVREKYYMKDIYNQLARSTASIGANIAESKFAQSDADYKSKIHISLKEANETKYWVNIITDKGDIDENLKKTICEKLDVVIRILISLCKDR